MRLVTISRCPHVNVSKTSPTLVHSLNDCTHCCISRSINRFSVIFNINESERIIKVRHFVNYPSVPMTHCKCQFCAVHGPLSWPQSNLSCRADQASEFQQPLNHKQLQLRKCRYLVQLLLPQHISFHGFELI